MKNILLMLVFSYNAFAAHWILLENSSSITYKNIDHDADCNTLVIRWNPDGLFEARFFKEGRVCGQVLKFNLMAEHEEKLYGQFVRSVLNIEPTIPRFSRSLMGSFRARLPL